MAACQVVVTSHGGPEVIRVEAAPLPWPGPDEVRVHVHAAGVSFADLLQREGVHPESPTPPYTPGWDVVGVVEAHGPGVTEPPLGTRVAALTVYGAQATHLCLPAARLVVVPPGEDAVEAVCLVMDWVVAYQLIHRVTRLRQGQSALVQGAAGSVGTALLQLGRLAGVRMWGTASAGKHDVVRRYGGIPIDYRTEDVVARVRAETTAAGTGPGVDAVFDAIGGKVTVRSRAALRPGGTLAVFGLTGMLDPSGRRRRNLTARTLWSYARVVGAWALSRRRIRLYSIQRVARRHPDWYQADLTQLFRLLEDGAIAPVIADRITLDDVREAHERLAAGAVTGKIVVALR